MFLYQWASLFCVTIAINGCGIPFAPLSKNSPKPGPMYLFGKPITGADLSNQPLNLAQPTSCTEARLALTQLLLTKMQWDLELQFQSWSPLEEDFPGLQNSEPSAATTSGEAAVSSSAPVDFTTTNNQVAGVEESDFIKNSGTHMYIAQDNSLRVVKSWPAEDMRVVATLELKDSLDSLLLVDDQTLIVVGRPRLKSQKEKVPVGPGANLSSVMPSYRPESSWTQYSFEHLSLTRIDITDPNEPQIKSRYVFRGSLHAMRRIGNSVRLILNHSLQFPKGVTTGISGQDYQKIKNREAYRNVLLQLYQKNSSIMRNASLTELLSPPHLDTDADALEDQEGLIDVHESVDSCAQLHIPQFPSVHFGLTKIVTINLQDDTPQVHQNVIPGIENLIYASTDSLYLASSTQEWRPWSMRDGVASGDALQHTTIHKFDLRKPNQAEYVASGIIEGTPLNQFSLDELDGVLRVATTVLQDAGEENQTGRTRTVNRVVTLGLQDGQLGVLGQTPDLAPNESIYSARFHGTRGFMVTFRRVDPLFSIDLSNPEKPTVLGELKIPGFSEYMQFISESHILTIGRDADEQSGRVGELKLSLFDVSDMANLTEVSSHIIQLPSGKDYQESQATHDHRAFTWFAKSGHLAIPVNHWDWQSSAIESSLQLFQVDPADGIRPVGSVGLNDWEMEPETNWTRPPSNLYVRRSVFADDFVYAITNKGVKAVRVEQPDTTVCTVEYDDIDAWSK
jgi:hypothetical protein